MVFRIPREFDFGRVLALPQSPRTLNFADVRLTRKDLACSFATRGLGETCSHTTDLGRRSVVRRQAREILSIGCLPESSG